jgi:thiol-disulfide isomerase/thioredoxin
VTQATFLEWGLPRWSTGQQPRARNRGNLHQGRCQDPSERIERLTRVIRGRRVLQTRPDGSSLRSAVVVIDFWATWCGPCVGAIPHLVELDAKFRSAGLEIVGVSLDSTEGLDVSQQARLEKFIRQHNMGYLILGLDKKETARILPAYGIKGIPQVVLIDRKGMVREVIVGGGRDAEIDHGVEKLLAER